MAAVAVIPPDAVAAVRRWIPAGWRDTALAIAGAESGWNLAAQGDYPKNFAQPIYGEILPWTCPPNDPNAPSVYGPWQIQLSWRTSLGIPDNCAFARWLTQSWSNSARAAARILNNGRGLGNWTTYTDGRYLAYLPEARAALGVPAGTPAPKTGGGAVTAPVGPPVAAWLLLGAVAFVGLEVI